MGTITNTSQLFPGGRRKINHTYCDLLAVTKAPTLTLNGLALEFVDGMIDINSFPFEFNETLDLSALGSLVNDGKYIVGAVPDYLAPVDRNEAVAEEVSYYVYDDDRRQSFARPFIDPAAQAAVDALGGFSTLSQKVYSGCAEPSDIAAFNEYSQAKRKIHDPRCFLKTLRPNGLKLVLVQVEDQDNYATCNALATMDRCAVKILETQIGSFPTDRKVMDAATFTADYITAEREYLVERVFGYTSEANLNDDINGVEQSFPFDLLSARLTHFVVYERTYPSTMPQGHEGNMPRILNMLSYQDSTLLGRINPIYLESLSPNAGFGTHCASRLTPYGDPVALVEVEVDTVAGTVTLVRDIYDSYVEQAAVS